VVEPTASPDAATLLLNLPEYRVVSVVRGPLGVEVVVEAEVPAA